MLSKKVDTKKGLTLIETLVAIGILSLSIAGPLALSARGLVFAKFARDQITAFYLAQEAVEVVRNIRDENMRNGADWLRGLDGKAGFNDCVKPNKCMVDVWTIGDSSLEALGWLRGVKSCSSGLCPAIKSLKNSDGTITYGHDFNQLSMCSGSNCEDVPFFRFFSIEPVVYPSANSFKDEVKLTVTVTWKRGTVNKDLVISESLFNL